MKCKATIYYHELQSLKDKSCMLIVSSEVHVPKAIFINGPIYFSLNMTVEQLKKFERFLSDTINKIEHDLSLTDTH